MNENFGTILASATVGIFLAFGVFVGSYLGTANHVSLSTPSLGGYASESTALVASSSIVVVGPQQIVTIFAANASCAGRTVALPPGSANVFVSFDSHVTPSAAVGYPLVASSTNPLLASTYGCTAITAFAPASTTITRTEYIR